jgi:hypothetical protein
MFWKCLEGGAKRGQVVLNFVVNGQLDPCGTHGFGALEFVSAASKLGVIAISQDRKQP